MLVLPLPLYLYGASVGWKRKGTEATVGVVLPGAPENLRTGRTLKRREPENLRTGRTLKRRLSPKASAKVARRGGSGGIFTV